MKGEKTMESEEDKEHSELNRYEFSGIEERHGFIPKWLAGVYVVLLIWMVYYLVRFWTDKG
jgi:hypothetical protein